jgi:hypothetical protein
MKGMKKLFRLRCLIIFPLLIICSTHSSHAQYCKVKKYYTLLNSGKFDEFKLGIKKYTRRHPSDAAVYFALARFFFEEDNPSYNIDSAKHNITSSIKAFDTPMKKRQQKIYASLGIRLPHAKYLDKLINSVAFKRASNSNTVEAWNFFIANFSDAAERNDAIAIRNRLAFEQAKDKYDLSSFEQFMKKYPQASEAGEARSLYEELLYRTKTTDSTYQSYFNFMQQYPNSPHFNEAKNNYERTLYHEKTKDHLLSSYISFLNYYPSSPYATIVQDSIYSLSTRVATKNNFNTFIKNFPDNPHINDAWVNYFQLSLIPYVDSTIHAFRSNYPLFPYPGIIDKEEMSLITDLKVTDVNGLYCYMDSATNKTVIPARFDDASDFSEGLAAVGEKIKGKELYGYINKYGDIKISVIFPYTENFNEGFAVVGNGNCDMDSCKYGMINRIGYLILPMIYDEILAFSEERCLLRKDSLYGFINRDFKVIVPLQYSDANSYSGGLATVKNDSGWTYIEKDGRKLINQYFIKALSFSEGLAAVENENQLWGYIDRKGNWVVKPKFQQAESFKEGKARVFVPAPKKKKKVIKLPKEMYIDRNGNFVKQ